MYDERQMQEWKPSRYEWSPKRHKVGCNKSDVRYHVWDSNDGAYTDYEYHCFAGWWIDGSDA